MAPIGLATASDLADALAIAIDLHGRVKQVLGNTAGSIPPTVRPLLESHERMLRLHVERYEERMRALRLTAPGAPARPEVPAPRFPLEDCLPAILDRTETYGAFLRNAMEDAEADAITQDLYIDSLREVDAQTYFLRSHLGARRPRASR